MLILVCREMEHGLILPLRIARPIFGPHSQGVALFWPACIYLRRDRIIQQTRIEPAGAEFFPTPDDCAADSVFVSG